MSSLHVFFILFIFIGVGSGLMCDLFKHPEPGNLTPVRDSPAIPRLRSVNSYTNIRAATTARNLNKSLQNLNLNEEGRRTDKDEGGGLFSGVKAMNPSRGQ